MNPWTHDGRSISGEFGAFVRKRRKELGLTLEDVARHLDLSIIYVCWVETGRRGPYSDGDLIALAPLIEVPPQDLLDAARLTRGVHLTLTDRSPSRRRALLALSQRWDALSDEDLAGLLALLGAT
jgi:transcriptional regulator with XRE-family HTH domain